MGKKFKYMIFISFLFLMLIPGVSAAEVGCGILGSTNSATVELLTWVVKLIRFGIPILIIVLGTTDFLTILFSGEEKTYKDAFSKFVKRLLIGVIVLFLPYIIYFLVRLSGVDKQYGIDNFYCGIIDAVSGVKITHENIGTKKSCDSKGYYWIDGECVSDLSSLDKNTCEENGYIWEEIQISVGTTKGHCTKEKKDNCNGIPSIDICEQTTGICKWDYDKNKCVTNKVTSDDSNNNITPGCGDVPVSECHNVTGCTISNNKCIAEEYAKKRCYICQDSNGKNSQHWVSSKPVGYESCKVLNVQDEETCLYG